MKPGSWWGLFKFFRNEDYLDALIQGTVYCSTPEYFRQNDEAGVGDQNESVSLALWQGRGIEDVEIRVNDQPIRESTRFVLRGTGMKDRLLHCWTLLRHPSDEAAFRQLISDLRRIRTEFGGHYAYVLPENIEPLLARMRALSGDNVEGGAVAYSDDILRQSPISKGMRYEYQREWRFLFDECSERSVVPRVYVADESFTDLISKNPEIRMFNPKTGATALTMRGPSDFAVAPEFDD